MLRNLFWGSRGPDVLAVQRALNLRRQPNDPKVDEIGVFGPATDAAVRLFQKRNHIFIDGIVGSKTRGALFPLATVTVRAIGMRLVMPGLGRSSPPRPNLLPGALTLDPPSPPGTRPGPLPTLGPLFGYQPVGYSGLFQPIATPPLAPAPVPGLSLPVHHLEIQPGASVSLGRRIDIAFSLTLSGVVMIGPEQGRHQEFSSGVIVSSPGAFDGGDWTVGWFAQLTHVEQLSRSGNFSWQPNAQVVAGNGRGPFLSASLSPAVVQFDATDSLSFSFGGPSAAATVDLNGGTLSWGLFSFGAVGKFQ